MQAGQSGIELFIHLLDLLVEAKEMNKSKEFELGTLICYVLLVASKPSCSVELVGSHMETQGDDENGN